VFFDTGQAAHALKDASLALVDAAAAVEESAHFIVAEKRTRREKEGDDSGALHEEV
jgi:hypothetical protein